MNARILLWQIEPEHELNLNPAQWDRKTYKGKQAHDNSVFAAKHHYTDEDQWSPSLSNNKSLEKQITNEKKIPLREK